MNQSQGLSHKNIDATNLGSTQNLGSSQNVASTSVNDKKSSVVNNTLFDPQPTETNDNIVTRTSKQDKSSDLKKTLKIDNELVDAVAQDDNSKNSKNNNTK